MLTTLPWPPLNLVKGSTVGPFTPLPHSLLCLRAQDILAYEAGGSLTVGGVELGPGDIKVLRKFKPPEGSQPGECCGATGGRACS